MRNVILYGCGNYYRAMKDTIKKGEMEGRFHILGISGRDLPSGNVLDGWRLIPQEKLLEQPFDSILIMSTAYEKEIQEELIAHGVSVHAFDYTLRPQYWDLSLNGISIFCNVCWGGFAAHTLGIECCSPTKDLWIAEDEFPKFLGKLEYYLSLDPVFIGWKDGVGSYDVDKYPLLAIDDITLYCNHDKNPDEAIDKWQRRKKRVNYKNMMAVFVTEYPEFEKSFFEVNTIDNKYSLVPWNSTNQRTIKVITEQGKTWFESALATAFPGGALDLVAMIRGYDHVVAGEESYCD